MEDFVTYEQAVKLRELRFDGYCNHCYYIDSKKFTAFEWIDHDGDVSADDLYTDNCSPGTITDYITAPLLSQVQKWLREEKGIDITPIPTQPYGVKKYRWALDRWSPKRQDWDENLYNTYEQALSAGIDKAIELLKDKSK